MSVLSIQWGTCYQSQYSVYSGERVINVSTQYTAGECVTNVSTQYIAGERVANVSTQFTAGETCC